MPAVLGLMLLCLAGCAAIPADPDGTLERVRGGVLRVGVSPHEPWTQVEGPDEPGGSEVDLVRGFAESLGAEVEWVVGGEEQLMTDLERGDLDLVIGGLTADTPWSDKAAITKPYTKQRDEHGEMRQHVLAAPLGENAFLLALERFLLEPQPV